MLLRITNYSYLDAGKLMAIYAESNLENTDYFYPDETDKDAALKKVEAGFMDFLQNDFFKQDESAYWILEDEGVWLCAARTCRIKNGLYYLEALETRPDLRGKGYASQLLSSLLNVLKEEGSFILCDCVSKKNIASLRTHEKCGFQIVSDEGYDYLQEEADDHDYGLEYRYS
ncbi:MAG: GNAT family N-acetyltransferase [Oscillospiraceae bacterium]|nr:GNAT family N-acetyltransferase [Oscillospiraceae bacterium]